MLKPCVALALTITLIASSVDVLACGDKFLVPGRGVRYGGRAPVRQAATILMFVRPGSTLDSRLTATHAAAKLRSVGYRLMLVATETAFAAAARSGAWDVVLVDLADAASIPRPVVAPAPAVLPVTYDAPKSIIDAAKRQYRRVLTSPRKSQAFVDAVDAVVAARSVQLNAHGRAGT
jgi:hypothetical protein